MAGQPWFWILGIVKDDAFAMLTTEPGPDLAPYHDRQVVLLPPGAGVHWLDLSAAQGLMLQPCPAGSLTVQKVWPESP
jgi:putative SOS response-associated peptidase YedK